MTYCVYILIVRQSGHYRLPWHKMPDTVFVSLSNFHNSRWPPRWPPIVYVHRNDPRTLTLCTILMNFGSFRRVSMMPNPMSMVPMTLWLAFYGHSVGHTLSAAILVAILNYESCSRIQKLYQAFYVSRVSWASESVEKKTISAKSGFTLKIMFGVLTITSVLFCCIENT